jgi:hypothetical protein
VELNILFTNDIRVLVRASEMKMANKQLQERPGDKWAPTDRYTNLSPEG